MKCANCERTLNEDSRFCDYCGQPVIKTDNHDMKTEFNFSALAGGILLSVLITGLLYYFSIVFGIPLYIGGLFLPFLWRKSVKIKE